MQSEPSTLEIGPCPKGTLPAAAATSHAGSDPAEADNTSQYGVFTRDGQPFAVPIEFVWEVMPGQAITRVPRAGPETAGLLSLRGEILAVLLADPWLGLKARPYDALKPILVLRQQDLAVAIQVDEMRGVTAIPKGEIHLGTQTSAGSTATLCHGSWRSPDKPWVTLVDADAFFARVRQLRASLRP